MRTLTVALIAVAFAAGSIRAVEPTVQIERHGHTVYVNETTGAVVVDVEPAAGEPNPPPPVVRITDSKGDPIPVQVFHPAPNRVEYVPVSRPLPPEQYTIVVPEAKVIHTIYVGLDTYGPAIARTGPDVIRAEGPFKVFFNEAIRVRESSIRVEEMTEAGPVEVETRIWVHGVGGEIGIHPERWGSFEVGATYRVCFDDGVKDRANNTATIPDQKFTVETDEFVSGGRSAYHYRLPELVVWCNRTAIGRINLSPRCAEPYDGGWLSLDSARGDPKEVFVNPHVDEFGHGTVYGVDARRGRLVEQRTSSMSCDDINVGRPGGLAVSPTVPVLFVSNRKKRELLAVDVSEPRLMARIGRKSLAGIPSNVAVSPDGTQVAVVLRRERQVVLLDATSLDRLGTLSTDERPADLAWVATDEGPSRLLVTCRGRNSKGGSVLAFDTATRDRTARIGKMSHPGRIAGYGARAWLVEEAANRVTAIDMADDGTVTRGQSIAAGHRPRDVALGPNVPDQLFVVNRGKGRITVLSISAGAIITKLKAKGALGVASLGER